MISVCSLLIYKVLVALFLGEVRLGFCPYRLGACILLAPSLKITFLSLLISCSINTNSNTLASTSPHSPFTTHHSFSSSESNNCFNRSLYFCMFSLVPELKYGVRLRSWAMEYLPGGKRRFYRLLERGSILLLSIIFYNINIHHIKMIWIICF